MIIREYTLESTTFQELMVPVGTNFINSVVKTKDEVVLIAETYEQDPIETFLADEEDSNFETVGVYIIPSNQEIPDEIFQNFIYVNSVAMNSEIGIILFHVYVEDIEVSLPDLFEENPNEEDDYV